MQKQLLVPAQAGKPSFGKRLRISLKTRALAAAILAAGGLFSANSAQAQTTLLTEGFETGAASWTLVNGTETNKWFIGTATAAAGTNSAYIDNGTGITNAYTVTTPSVVHLYRDVTFPAGQGIILLSFKWKAQGEGTGSDFDNLKVFVSPAAATVTAGTEMPVADKIGAAWYNFSPGTGYATTTIQIPASYAGTTKRLVFSWKNDNTSGTQPPVSVDDILITTRVAAPLTGTYTINNTLPTAGTNFISFADALTRINFDGITGPVTFNVSAGQSFNEDGLILNGTATATNTIMFQKSGTGANPMIRPTGTTALNEAGFIISGGDYITLDGIDINISTGSAVEYGYVIRNSSALNGAMNNTIRNANITLNRTNTSSIAVLQSSNTSFGGGFTPTATSGSNQNNTYNNLTIQNVYNGILLSSSSGSFPDNNNTVSGNIVGGATAGDLAGGTTSAYGIKASAQSNVKIFNNQIRNITATSAAVDGLFLDLGIGLSEIYNNKISDLALSTATSTSVITGMRINTYTVTNGNTTRVFNNFVWGFTHPFVGTATASRRIIGIFVQSNGAGIGNTQNIDFNSVRIETPATYTASSTTLEIGTTSGATMNVRNNILANFSAAQTGVAKHYTWVSTSATLTGIAGSISDNNILYIANTTNGFTGLSGTTDRTTLAAWRLATNQDLNSKAGNPQFISATDLHINPAVATEVESGGSFFGGAITWATTDIDANVRNTSTPDIGADEGTFILSDLSGPGITIGTLLNNTSSLTNRTFTATITDLSGIPTTGTLIPRVYFSKGGTTFFSTPGVLTSGTGTNGNWTFTIDYSLVGGVANGDRIFYFVVAQDILGNTNSSPFGNSTVTDVNTVTNITSSYAYNVNAAITGVITVPGTYPSLTLAGGLFDAINKSVVSGNVTVNITADLTAETGAISLNQWAEEGTGTYSVTIRPSAATNRTISGTSAAGFGLIRSNGADRFTIDGSFGGTGNYLTIVDNGAVANTFALLVSTGSVNNTYKNLNISTGTNTVASVLGIFVSGAGNNNLTLENNTISKAYIGISVQNDPTSPGTGLIIRNNTIGSATTSDIITFKGIIVSNATGALIAKNTIFNMQTSASINNAGIEIGDNTANTVITQNSISGMRSSSATGWGSYGINLASGTNTNGITISNNMISDILTANYSATSTTFNAFGIRIIGGNNHMIYYNSVNLFGAPTAGTTGTLSAAFIVTSTAVTGLDIRNNVFANTMTGLTGFKSYTIYLSAAANAATIDYNDYFVSTTTGASGFVGYLTSERVGIAEWRTATGKDVNSVSIDPQFVAPTNLHIPNTNSALNNLGTPIAGLTVDFDNDTRSTVTPDMGADEFGATAAAPTVTAGGPTTFCTGGSVVLTATSTSMGATFTWQLNGTAIPGAISNTYTATTSGSYTAVASPGGASTPIVVTVNTPAATPTITAAGSTTICAGSSVILTAASTTTGATFQWFNNATAITGATSATFTANAAGSYTVVATANGCPSTASSATTVTVTAAAATPTITAGGSTTICAGSSVVLTAASTTTGATFQWFNNATAITGATSATFTANAAGSYTVVATAGGCASAASTATTVTVTPLPATPTISQNGGTLTSSSATGNQWYLNGVAIPGATSQTYVTTANGAYTLQVTANGCTSALSAVRNVTNTGIADALAGMSVQVYPNPATGSFNVKLNGYQKEATVILYNLAGQQITASKASADDKAQNIDIRGLAAGTYLLKVTSEKGVQVNRLVVQ